VSKDGKLGFEPEQLSFGGAIELSLLGSGVSSISLGDMAGDRKGGDDECIRRRFGFAPRAVAHEAKYFAAERNRLLPDFEISQASCHGHTMAPLPCGTDIKPLRPGPKARAERSRPSAACENPRL